MKKRNLFLTVSLLAALAGPVPLGSVIASFVLEPAEAADTASMTVTSVTRLRFCWRGTA